MWLRALAGISALLIVVLTACGETDGQDADAASGVDGQHDEMIAESTVLEEGSHGPKLRPGGVMDSLRRKCAGPDLVGWDWNAVSGFRPHGRDPMGCLRRDRDLRSGRRNFTLTRSAVPAEKYDGTGLPVAEEDEPVWHTPCPEPDGGRRVVDPTLSGQHNLNQTMRAARARHGSLRAQLDEQYGAGPVAVATALQPFQP